MAIHSVPRPFEGEGGDSRRFRTQVLLSRHVRLANACAAGLIALLLVSASACTAAGTGARAGARPHSPAAIHTDALGRRVEVPRRPERIVSLAPSVTEVLYMLDAGDRLVGVTSSCDWPEDARRKPKIGSLLHFNYEAILAARPDLVIASTAGNDRDAVFKLADFGIPVYVTAPRSVATIFDTVRRIGHVLGCPERADRLAAQASGRLEEIRRRLAGLPPLRAFFITWFDPLLAPGKRTFETDVLRQANVLSISGDIDEYYPRYSLEQVLAQDPDVILTVRHEGRPFPDLKRLPGWQRLRAVESGRVYILSEVLQHPSPRFVEGVEELAKKLYPERFP